MRFDRLKSGDDIKAVLKEAFDMELPVSGGWGYEKDDAVMIEKGSLPTSQVQYIFATMRANLQMNMTQPKEDRFGGITVEESSKESIDGYEKIVYIIKAIKEDIYEKLIQEYKEGYGKDSFDMEAHFAKRAENTIVLDEEYWFKLK